MFRRWLAALLLAGLACCAALVQAEVPVPALSARVTDLTGTLSAEQKATLETKLAAFEAKKGSQVAVLMLPSTKPEEIEQYSIRVAEAWKVGRKGTDDGVILVVAKDDHRLRIEVGYGLEGAIPDALAKRIIDETITPRFKAGDFYGGISAGVDQLTGLISGEKLPPPSDATQGQRRGSNSVSDLLIPGIFFVLIAGSVLRAVLGRFPGALVTGAVTGFAAWALFGLGIAGIAALVAFIFTLVNTGTFSPGRGGYGAGGGFGGGSGSSSWGGGGGGFGGGGSSGRW